MTSRGKEEVAALHGISPEWLDWAWRWYSTSTLLRLTRLGTYGKLRQIGRWLLQNHPEITSPQQWDRQFAAQVVGAIDRFNTGDYSSGYYGRPGESRPWTAHSKNQTFTALRVFFTDCQQWGWLEVRFNPNTAFAIPNSIRRSMGTNPRVIADDIWAKLLWAGLNLTADDVPSRPTGEPSYPIEFMKAVAVVWLFAGLRNNEICRLRRGCVRWDEVTITGPDGGAEMKRVCLLEIPLQKTGPPFVKPVDAVVGDAIEVGRRSARLSPNYWIAAPTSSSIWNSAFGAYASGSCT